MEKSFNSLEELQAEIGILKLKSSQQESLIHEKLSSPFAIFKTIGSMFQSNAIKKADDNSVQEEDFISVISRIILPIILNKSIFRGSGFITKTLVTLFSQRAAKNVNMDLISNVIDRISHVFKGKGKSLKTVQDYGIPPDSETY